MDNEQEAERRRIARLELAQRLSTALPFALGTKLTIEAALIAKLIEATLTNTANDLYSKLRSK